jgi:hypothetical protein
MSRMRQEPYIGLDMSAGQLVEHICLASEDVLAPARRRESRNGPTFKFVSRVFRCETELAFITDHRLGVRVRRRGKAIHKYIVDLRFIDADVIAERRFDRRALLAAFALAGLAVLGSFVALQTSGPRWYQVGMQSSIALAVAVGLACIVRICRQLMTFELRSVHGDVSLARVMGGLNSADARREFVAELSGRVEAARGEHPPSRQRFLCDEMREHHRLWNEGVLSDVTYETSKRRILAAHA